jgi:hypothetical protein
MRPHRGVLILVLGILGFVLCGIFTSIPAWVMGNSDLKAIQAGQMDPSGQGLTQAGKICGIIATILNLIGVAFFLALMAFGAVGAAVGSR